VLTITFTPSAIGAETGTLTVNDTASNAPQTAALTGTGLAQAALAPTSLTFGTEKAGTPSGAKVVTLTNNLTTALAITGITFGGANPGDFSETDNCVGSVAAKSTCTIKVTFKPGATGSRSGTLQVADSANNTPQTILLTGTGGTGTTYNVSLKVGPASVIGSIATDGTIGVLAPANILGWNLLLNDPTLIYPPNAPPTTPCNGLPCTMTVAGTPASWFGLAGTDLSATATQLRFNFSGTDTGYFFLGDSTGFSGLVWFGTTPVNPANYGPGESVLINPAHIQLMPNYLSGQCGNYGYDCAAAPLTGTQVIGTAAP